jgi:hypothetical protein
VLLAIRRIVEKVQIKGEWISNLMDDYKKEPGGSVKLKEKTQKPLMPMSINSLDMVSITLKKMEVEY